MNWINDLPKNNWINYLISTKPQINFSNNSERKKKLNELLEDLKKDISQRHFGKAFDVMSLGLYLGKDLFFEQIKSSGIFRNSSYLDSKNPIIGFSQSLLLNKDFFLFNEEQILHLQSLNNSFILYEELKRLNKYINIELEKFKITHNLPNSNIKQSKFKALLAINEVNFITNVEGNRFLNNYGEYDFHSKEEVSSAISELVDRYQKSIGIQEFDLNVVDAEFAMGSYVRNVITATCQFLALKNLEIEVENFGYQLIIHEKKLVVRHTLENFAKSMELSNIQYQFQQIANAHLTYLNNKQVPSLNDLAEAFHTAMPKMFAYKTEPTPRYVLSVPINLYEKLLGDKDINLFREEIGVFMGIQTDMLITLKNAKEYIVRPKLSYYEFLRLQRFFLIQAVLLRPKFLELIRDGEIEKVYRSVVGIFKIEKLKEALQSISSLEQIDSFLDILIWLPSAKEKTLDLQYKPFITKDDYIIVPTSVIGKSNLARNIFLSEAKANNNLKGIQPQKHISIAAILKNGFELHGFFTESEVTVKYQGSQNESDIDFMAFKDEVLFIAECKDSTFPTDSFEMRTPYSNLKKAASQINYIKSALLDDKFQKTFCEKYGFSKISQIVPVIVSSNNKMWGSFLDGVSIRNVKELSAFLAHGTWTISEDDNVNIYELWKDNEFHIQDLIDFCGNKSAHEAMFNACSEVLDSVTEKILKSSYKLDLIQFTKEMKKKFTYSIKSRKIIEA